MSTLARLRQLHHDATREVAAGRQRFVSGTPEQYPGAAALVNILNAEELLAALPVLLQIAQAAEKVMRSFDEADMLASDLGLAALREALGQLGSSTAASSGGEQL